MAIRTLKTMDEVMLTLGGPAVVARLTRSKMPAVSNWLQFGRFPAKYFLIMTAALARKRARAPASLWGMEPAREAAE